MYDNRKYVASRKNYICYKINANWNLLWMFHSSECKYKWMKYDKTFLKQ